MNDISLRTIKTAVAAIAALLIANTIGLEFAPTAAILAILTVADTREEIVSGGKQRLISAVIALIIGTIIQNTLGLSPYTFGLYLLIFTPISFLLGVQIGLGPSSVLITHLFTVDVVTIPVLINELGLVAIGVICAVATNIYVPDRSTQVKDLIEKIDEKISMSLRTFGRTITENFDISKCDYILADLKEHIDKAKVKADKELKNTKSLENQRVIHLLSLREEEYNIFEDIFRELKKLPPEYSQGVLLSRLFEETANAIDENRSLNTVYKELYKIREEIELSELPKTREDLNYTIIMNYVLGRFESFIELSDNINKLEKVF